MSIPIRFERDRHGFPRAIVAPPFELVGAFLEQDIQSSQISAAECIATIEDVETGRLPSSEGTGNAFTLSLAPGQARIECVWDESLPPCVIGLSELREAIEGWAKFVSNERDQEKPT